MEEVDSILISQLREIGCDLDDDITGICSMDSFKIMQCVTICLHRFTNDPEIVEMIPDVSAMNSSMNMSVKYKLANQLSTCIQKIGYKSDIGYQTFLYSNEHEIRRLLLFLVEQISSDSDDKTFDDDQSPGWRMDQDVLQKLKNFKLNTVWIPYSSYHEDGVEDDIKYQISDSDFHDKFDHRTDHNAIHGLSYLGISIQSYLSRTLSTSLKRYIDYKFLEKDKNRVAVMPEKLVDFLEWNSHYWKENHSGKLQTETDFLKTWLNICQTQQINPICSEENVLKEKTVFHDEKIPANIVSDSIQEQDIENDSDPTVQKSPEKDARVRTLVSLKEQLHKLEQEVARIRNEEVELAKNEQIYQEKCKIFEASYKTKEELENGIAAIKQSIEEISSTWEEMQKELVDKLKQEKLENHAQNEEHMAKVKRINSLKKSIAQKLKEIQSKEYLINELESKVPEQWPMGRGSYTRKIMEIINNVKKQNDETKKVVLEMKTVQKDINNLHGKIERSFTVAEEILFREAKQNEWNRKCYKSLVLLQSTFTELLQAITDIGVHLREIRKLEEMVESENNRKTSSNLTRINADLEQIRLENKQLRQKLQEASTI